MKSATIKIYLNAFCHILLIELHENTSNNQDGIMALYARSTTQRVLE
jgi:hypothetical protein